MIRYDLRCDEGHEFDSWFASASAFDELAARSLVTCAVCGGSGVRKALMAPLVAASGEVRKAVRAAEPQPMLSAPVPNEIAEKLAALRREIEAKSTWVGRAFPARARAMHLGEAEPGPIHGEATGEEAKALIEEGVPVAPLPFLPRRDD